MQKKIKSYREAGDAVILYPHNYINDVEGEKLDDLCAMFLEKGFKKIVIDFSDTDLINSIGVSIIIGIIERVKERKGVVLFSGLKSVNYDIFSLVGLTRHIQVFSTEEEALGGMKPPDGQIIV